MNDRRRAILMLVLANAMWGATFPVMKGLNLQIDHHFGVDESTASNWLRMTSAAWMIAIRFGLALTMFVIFFHRVVRNVRLPHLAAGMALGTFFYFGMLLQVIALGTIPASRSGFLTSLAVVFTPLINGMVLRRIPRRTVIAGVILALIGVAFLTEILVVDLSTVSLATDALTKWTTGDSLTIVSALFFSSQIILVDYFGKRYESVAFTPGMFATAVLLGFTTFVLTKGWVPESPLETTWWGIATEPGFLGLIGALGLFPSLLAFAWMNRYQPFLSATQAAVIYTSEPFFASTWAMFLPAVIATYCGVVYANETFSWPLVVGGVFVLAANVLALWPEKRIENRPTPVDPIR